MATSYLQRFFDLSLDMFCVANFEGYFVKLNPAWEKTLGWSLEELCSKPFSEFVHEADKQSTSQQMERLLQEKPVIHFKNRYLHKDGSWKTLSWQATVDPDTKAIFAVARDITAFEKASKLASLGEMAGEIAHEINNPLAIIHGKASQLREKVRSGMLNSEVLEEGLKTLEKTAMRIAKIVRGLRAFSRSGEMDPFEEVSLTNILDDTLPLCWDRLKNQGIEFRLKSIPSTKLFCRPSQISQIVVNLMNNSADAVEALEDKWIELNCFEKDQNVLITITDSGTGIPEPIAHQMMDPFFTTKGAGKGTGLGLSIVKGIVEDHQGKVFYNQTHPNTQFVVELPMDR